MPRLQLFLFPVTAALACCLTGCGDDVPTVADYLHDIDKAEAVVKIARNNPAKYAADPASINAQQAWIIRTSLSDSMLACWPKMNGAAHVITTATTDHACLDRHGYKR